MKRLHSKFLSVYGLKKTYIYIYILTVSPFIRNDHGCLDLVTNYNAKNIAHANEKHN